jgi:hypothetical protein
MSTESPPAEVEIVQRSMRCFFLGIFSLIPLIGPVFSVMSFVHSGKVRQLRGSEWNPAGRYWFWGGILAWLGILMTVAAFFIALIVITLQSEPQ